MTRKELREKAESLVCNDLILSTGIRLDPDKAEQIELNTIEIIESFGLEIAKSVAEECAKLVEPVGSHPARIIREYAKRLEGDEK